MKNLLIIRGIPGSGKSTLAKSLVDDGHYDIFLEADQYFMKDGEYKFDPSQLSKAHQWCKDEVKKNLDNGKRVIVSNTYTTWGELFNILEIVDGEADVIEMITFYGSIHNVPEEAMKRMRNRWIDKTDFLINFDHTFGRTFGGEYFFYGTV